MEYLQFDAEDSGPNTRDAFERELFAPLPGASPDNVRPEVVQEEMASFGALMGQVR